MKILMVNKFLYSRGGCENYMLFLSEQLKKMGHEVQFFGMYDETVGYRADLGFTNVQRVVAHIQRDGVRICGKQNGDVYAIDRAVCVRRARLVEGNGVKGGAVYGHLAAYDKA